LYPTMLTMSKGIAWYLKLLFIPYPLSLEYLFPVSTTISDPFVILSLIVILASLVLMYKCAKDRPVFSFGILFFFVGLLPVSNIVPIKSVIQERFLFLSMVGFALIIADLLNSYPAKGFLFWLIGIMVLSPLTIVRPRDWRTPRDLINSTLR